MTSPEGSTTSARSGSASPREMNQQMVTRLLAMPTESIPEGGYGLRVLEHTGRDSGQPHRTPVGVLARAQRRYLVCPDRTRDWPRNLTAHSQCVIRGGDRREELIAQPVDGDEGIDAVQTYLSVVQAPWALRAFGLPDDPTREHIAQEMARMIVFRLTDVSTGRQDVTTTEQES